MGIDLRDVDQPIGTLSGGERQCVAIARAVHFGAKVLILDEPTAALGVKQSGVVLRYMLQASERGLGVVFITHNPHHAYPVGDRFLLLKRGRPLGYHEKKDILLEELTAPDGRRRRAGGAHPRARAARRAHLSRCSRSRPTWPSPRPAPAPDRTPAPRPRTNPGARGRRTPSPLSEGPLAMTVRIGLIGAGRIGAMHAAHLDRPARPLGRAGGAAEHRGRRARAGGRRGRPDGGGAAAHGRVAARGRAWTASSWRPARPRTRS